MSDHPNGNGAGLATIEPQRGLQTQRLTADIEGAKLMIDKIRELQATVLREDIDYGVIPGTKNKPCLLKPGAESLLAAFALGTGLAHVEVTPIPHDVPGHREVRVSLPIINRATGVIVGSGDGSCSTMESKYRYRGGKRSCPACGKTTIIKGKEEYGGGWVCLKSKDGCGAKYVDNAPEIVGQQVGQVENQNPADEYNTVLKMAKKRALVDGALTVTAASGVFTQDVEERQENDRHYEPEPHHQRNIQQPQRQQAAQQQAANKPAPLQAADQVRLRIGKIERKGKSDGSGDYFQAVAIDPATGRGGRVGIWHVHSFCEAAHTDQPETLPLVELVADIVLSRDGRFFNLENISPLGESAEPLDADFTELGPPLDMEGAPGHTN